MKPLELQQRGLLALLKNRGGVPDDPYLCEVARSRELAMLRKIALWWVAYALEAQCRYTTRLLKRLGSLNGIVAEYFDRNKTSPFVEELSLGFLGCVARTGDPLIRPVAQFESALLAIRVGAVAVHEILWDRHPERVIVALEAGDVLPPPEHGILYRMRVDKDLQGLVACNRECIMPTRKGSGTNSGSGAYLLADAVRGPISQ